MKRISVVLLLALAACGGGGDSRSDQTDAIRKAATTYSDAFLSGDADAAYGALSARCKDRIGEVEFTSVVQAAKDTYGSALKFKTFEAEVNGRQARVTYTYAISAINQTDEPWVKEDGRWRQDDC